MEIVGVVYTSMDFMSNLKEKFTATINKYRSEFGKKVTLKII